MGLILKLGEIIHQWVQNYDIMNTIKCKKLLIGSMKEVANKQQKVLTFIK